MKRIDGKEYYTFVGLINRMDGCRNGCCLKDIPEEVEFADTIYKLDPDRTFYYDPNTGVTLAEVVGEVYGMNMLKILTEHVFIVTPKEKIFLTAEGKEFIRLCNAILRGGMGIKSIYISTDTFEKLLCMRFKDGKQLYVPIGMHAFDGIPAEKEYSLKDLEIYE